MATQHAPRLGDVTRTSVADDRTGLEFLDFKVLGVAISDPLDRNVEVLPADRDRYQKEQA